MTPEQKRLLAETFAQLENRLDELSGAVFAKLFDLSPESRRLFKEDLEQQKLQFAHFFAEFIHVKTRSQHFLPVTQKGGEAVIPGIGALGSRYADTYGVGSKHYAYMREALLHAIRGLLGNGYSDEIGQAWAVTFDMLAEAMQKHSGENAEAVALASLFHTSMQDRTPAGKQQPVADCYLDSAKDLEHYLDNYRS